MGVEHVHLVRGAGRLAEQREKSGVVPALPAQEAVVGGIERGTNLPRTKRKNDSREKEEEEREKGEEEGKGRGGKEGRGGEEGRGGQTGRGEEKSGGAVKRRRGELTANWSKK